MVAWKKATATYLASRNADSRNGRPGPSPATYEADGAETDARDATMKAIPLRDAAAPRIDALPSLLAAIERSLAWQRSVQQLATFARATTGPSAGDTPAFATEHASFDLAKAAALFDAALAPNTLPIARRQQLFDATRLQLAARIDKVMSHESDLPTSTGVALELIAEFDAAVARVSDDQNYLNEWTFFTAILSTGRSPAKIGEWYWPIALWKTDRVTRLNDLEPDRALAQRFHAIGLAELQLEAEAGDRHAAYRLGLHALETNEKRDPATALRWLTYSACRGEDFAALFLQRLYTSGASGIPADPTAAKRWQAVASAINRNDLLIAPPLRPAAPTLDLAPHRAKFEAALGKAAKSAKAKKLAFDKDTFTTRFDAAFVLSEADPAAALVAFATLAGEGHTASAFNSPRGSPPASSAWRARTSRRTPPLPPNFTPPAAPSSKPKPNAATPWP